jgi:hypothetical protein
MYSLLAPVSFIFLRCLQSSYLLVVIAFLLFCLLTPLSLSVLIVRVLFLFLYPIVCVGNVYDFAMLVICLILFSSSFRLVLTFPCFSFSNLRLSLTHMQISIKSISLFSALVLYQE